MRVWVVLLSVVLSVNVLGQVGTVMVDTNGTIVYPTGIVFRTQNNLGVDDRYFYASADNVALSEAVQPSLVTITNSSETVDALEWDVASTGFAGRISFRVPQDISGRSSNVHFGGYVVATNGGTGALIYQWRTGVGGRSTLTGATYSLLGFTNGYHTNYIEDTFSLSWNAGDEVSVFFRVAPTSTVGTASGKRYVTGFGVRMERE